jgi:hypothetical protein
VPRGPGGGRELEGRAVDPAEEREHYQRGLQNQEAAELHHRDQRDLRRRPRPPICSPNSEQSSASSQGIAPPTPLQVIEDASGSADRCTGQTLRCPAGFILITRAGQDLCWDSVENKNKYKY